MFWMNNRKARINEKEAYDIAVAMAKVCSK